jgi:thiol-disulfide isomerase/thioredoxin
MDESHKPTRMLIVIVMFAATVIAHAAGDASPSQRTTPPTERRYLGQLDQIGPFSWLDLEGRRWTERDFRGKVLIVQEWGAGCGPCIAEFPEVQKLFEAARRDSSIAFVSLDMDRDPAAIHEFLQQFRKEYSFPVLFAGAALKIALLPQTLIVDREGYVREILSNEGSDLVDAALALTEAVKHRLPVSALPPEVLQERRRQNERDGANSR